MEVDSMVEIFRRSVERFAVKYTNYIGDGDSKTYSAIVNAAPYGNSININKKKCVRHVQKRIDSRLRALKNKSLVGRNKLTGKIIDNLSIYYGLAIRRNCESKDKMKTAIWATFYHYSSTDEKPHHENCPEGSDSWQRAKVDGIPLTPTSTIMSLLHDVLEAIRPIYDDLKKDTLLERCVGGFTQNNNESFNNII
ncbi:hypothetical protein ALC57_05402 [Trachymyrmex cornetzi]|uniref:Mutator-like transposase domain-containing protein n=1 Tax=Trachymyrmex cornetzi TaxID=471704 RepID=A0A151JB08_9HYME|nr:hypothetical protein ALC57_08936 [Trachymyrmex cornetzi]KYN22208.1 hypothetical protein ALC57_05402 [Trachymyrmex cornetzi]